MCEWDTWLNWVCVKVKSIDSHVIWVDTVHQFIGSQFWAAVFVFWSILWHCTLNIVLCRLIYWYIISVPCGLTWLRYRTCIGERFTGRGDIGEKLVSHIQTVPWINITAAKYVTKWSIFRLNKSLNKSVWLFEKHKKIKITLSFSACVLVAVWRTEISYYAVATFLDGDAARSAAHLVVNSLDAGHQSLIIIMIFVRIIVIMSAFVKHKINCAGIEKSFQFPLQSLPNTKHSSTPRSYNQYVNMIRG